MAGKIKMQLFSLTQNPIYQQKSPVSSIPLNASMIARVHNVKGGCSSCGKK